MHRTQDTYALSHFPLANTSEGSRDGRHENGGFPKEAIESWPMRLDGFLGLGLSSSSRPGEGRDGAGEDSPAGECQRENALQRG